MAREELRVLTGTEQEKAANPASLAPLIEALSARLAACEGELATSRSALRAHLLECDASLDVARSRLGQARNVEQRCKRILETVRALAQQVELRIRGGAGG